MDDHPCGFAGDDTGTFLPARALDAVSPPVAPLPGRPLPLTAHWTYCLPTPPAPVDDAAWNAWFAASPFAR